MISQKITYEELLKENEKLKSEIKKLNLNNSNSFSDSFIMNNSDSNSSIKLQTSLTSLTNQIKEENSTIIFSPDNPKYEITKILPFSFIDSHFICRICHNVPIIKFNDSLKNFNVFCGCCVRKNISLENIIKNYVMHVFESNANINEIESYLKCEKHHENFQYYCKIDKTHLCSNCLKEKYFHQNHPLYFFDFYYFQINQNKQCILDILLSLKKDVLELNDCDQLLYLFSIIFNDFSLYPNYAHFVIIEQAYNFLGYFIPNKNNNQIINDLDFQKILIINNKKILYDNMIHSDIIIEIDIAHSNINDITKICELNFVSLEKLYLSDNSISNIEPLRRAKFKKIKNLGFAHNKIGDENIPYLLEMKFEQLEELNLFSNNLTDCKIFNLQNSENLPNLKIFNMGNNRIDWAKRNSIDLTFNFKTLIKFDLSGGIFDVKTIENINSFNMIYLKIIDLSRCDINSLKFVNNLEISYIEEFYLNDTFINEFYPLIKYKNLRIIEMVDNYIDNINKLKIFIEELSMLTKFNIKGNNINMALENNKSIIESVKDIRNNLDIIT